MSNKLQAVVLHAIKTFNLLKRNTGNLMNDVHFKTLSTLVNDLSFVDISLPARLFSRNEQTLRSKNPVEYLAVYEDKNVVIGVFIIKEGAKIPLHDHPGMHGLIKVLHGELQVISYNVPDGSFDAPQPSSQLFFTQPLAVTKNNTIRISAKDKCSLLTPTHNNIHEVTCLAGPAAFLDILAPPYDDDQCDSLPRACHYFKEDTQAEAGITQLIQIPCPEVFWSSQDV